MSKKYPWWVTQFGRTERVLIDEAFASNFINDGDLTTRFENDLASRVASKYAVATSSGTAAIFLALAGLDIGHGDEVLVPDVTFIATANAVTLTGARPVLVDVDPCTLNMDPRAAERALSANTKAIVPVHVSGRGADMPSLLELGKRHNLPVIEDAAESLVSRRFGKTLGTLGVAGCVSFSPNKHITTGQGGMVFTNSEQLQVRLRELKDQGRPVRGTGGDDPHPRVGYNFKLTNVQAAIGLGQLELLDQRAKRLRDHYRIYREQLADLWQVEWPGFAIEEGETPQWVDVIVHERRNELEEFLAARQMGCRRFWHPLHTQPPYRQPDAAFPNSSRLMPKALWLPSAFTLTDADIAEVCRAIREFFGRKSA